MKAVKGLGGGDGGQGITCGDGSCVYKGMNDGDGQVHRGHDDSGARATIGTIWLIFIG